MYKLGKRSKSKRRRRILVLILLLIFVGFIVLGYLFLKDMLDPKTNISGSKAKVTKIAFDNGKTRHFVEKNFEFDIPADWEVHSHDTSPYNVYRYRGTDKTSTGRQLEIYEDTIPSNFAVNRVLAIESNGNRITVRGSVSDNCTEYTKDTAPIGQVGTKAKWQNVDFLCDHSNPQRNVVGTASVDGINTVHIGSSTTVLHQYFFVYTENSFAADYGALYSVLQSFALK